jgi:hypothetical protein
MLVASTEENVPLKEFGDIKIFIKLIFQYYILKKQQLKLNINLIF